MGQENEEGGAGAVVEQPAAAGDQSVAPAQAAPAPPAPESAATGGDGGAPTGATPDVPFYDGLNRKTADFIKSKGFTDLQSFADSYVHSQKMITAQGKDNMLLKPVGTREDDPDGWKVFDQAMGIPAAADKYEMPKIEGVNLSDDATTALQKLAYDNNLSGEAFGKFMEGALGLVAANGSNVSGAAAGQLEAWGNDLRQRWGANYDANEQAAMGAVRAITAKMGNTQFADYLEQSGLGNDPRMIEAMNVAAQAMAEGGGLPGAGGDRSDVPSLQQAELAITEFNKKHKDALSNKSAPNRKALIAERSRLYEVREQAASR